MSQLSEKEQLILLIKDAGLQRSYDEIRQLKQ